MEAKQVPIERIVCDPANPRKHRGLEETESLKASIAAHGIKVPLLAYQEAAHYALLEGHRRLEAAIALGWKDVPVVVFAKRPDDGEMLLAQLTINTHRQSLNPDDEYEAFVRLAHLKEWTASDLAKGLAVSPAEVTRVLAIGKLSPEERRLVRDGKLSKSAAYALARMTPEERRAALPLAAQEQVTRDQLNRQARRKPRGIVAKAQRVRCHWSGASVAIQREAGLTLVELIELLEGLTRECRKARSQGLDVDTIARVLRDRSRAQASSANEAHIETP